MQVSFHVKYKTIWGQRLCILGSIPELGAWEPAFAINMQYTGSDVWALTIDISPQTQCVEYRYLVRMNNDTVDEEWEQNHSLAFDPSLRSLYLMDSWQAKPDCLAFYSAAFTDAIFARPLDLSPDDNKASSEQLLIKVFAPLTKPEHSVALAGNQEILGEWNPAEAPLLNCCGHAEWCIAVDAGAIRFPLEYKFIIVETNSRAVVCWEEGDNRRLNLPAQHDGAAVCLSGLFLRKPLHAWRGAGTAVPVFALRTEKSWGVGDLGDLRLFVDWVHLTRQRFVQVLPMNDTTSTCTWKDSYPYSAISIRALHPMYINLPTMGTLNDPSQQSLFDERRRELNALDEIDYEAVTSLKLEYCRAFYRQEGHRILESDDYRKFYADNCEWLFSYSAFSWLRDKYSTADFTKWGAYANYNPVRLSELFARENAQNELSFYCFLQYVLHVQFAEVAAYSRSCGIVLKGDLPIGVNRLSVDAWTDPQYFNNNSQAGAPPDAFSATGQNWSFPTYNWDAMENDNFMWWKVRFAAMSAYFDCFRIDHVLGFFRIWEIPTDYIEGLCGHFNPSLPLSADEIEGRGMAFNEGRFTTPHIHQQHLATLFGPFAGEACDAYLAQSSSQHYVLKSFCNTQAKIAAMFAGHLNDRTERIRSGLNVIAGEVLFLHDPRHTNRFHPRISAAHSYIYNELSESDRYAFDHLYYNFYYHRHEEFWKEQAFRRLTPLLRSTRMLPCGEDLGMIPASVPEVMNKLQILSLEIERMSKSTETEFTILNKLPYLSVCTTSTHDMAPLRNWWEEDRDQIQRYYNKTLHCEGQAPAECTPSVARRIVENHLESPSMLAIIPLQDLLAIDCDLRRPDCHSERINIPACPDHYWRYRMHINIEKLLAADNLNTQIKCMIRKSGRE